MTDLSSVRSIVSNLSLSESTIDTPAVVESLASLKRAILELESADPALVEWLTDEHYAGGVFNVAATMSKRAQLAGGLNQFARLPLSGYIDHYNRWAAQLTTRLDAVENGSATPAQYLPQLAKFRADPVNNTP